MKNNRSSGIAFTPTFTHYGDTGYEHIDFVLRDAVIESSTGAKVFEQRNVSVPSTWSQTALNIAASKYLHGRLNSPERETSVKQLIDRVVSTITAAGRSTGYFTSRKSSEAFASDLTYLLVNQKVAFNSPVWFNVGCETLEPENKAASWSWDSDAKKTVNGENGYRTPQCSACFINSVKDSMSSILDLAKTEGMLFKWGSGTGTNFSVIRGSKEQLSGGGTASGPLSFMKGLDAFAGVIKSGGKTRRAAKMAILNVDHPDIEDFIAAKGKEELKAQALVREGYDGSGPDAEAYSSIFYQNANNSVRVSDDFMEAASKGETWSLKARVDGTVVKTVDAAALLRSIAEETWRCGDPGMQFDTTINKWHTSKASGRINASNPCSEYMFLDDSACNLASFNLVKFIHDDVFDADAFVYAIKLMVVAQDILVDMAGYPTELIAKNSHDFRPLGLGYANLGSLLMSLGLPYDSEEGRAAAATLTSLMGAAAYRVSAEIAAAMPKMEAASAVNVAKSGSFPGYSLNEDSFIDVMGMHLAESQNLEVQTRSLSGQWNDLAALATAQWTDAIALGTSGGFRNAQVTVLAPTGTIGFMMDCATTGVEPMLGVVTHKKLVGGGVIISANATVPVALRRLGYDQSEIDAILSHIGDRGTIEGAPALKQQDLAVFDGAFTPTNGVRSISWDGHLKMMAAVQPFLSGAISKTVNLPHTSTVDDIANAYIQAWRLGLKSVAIYRDGSKSAQPLSVSKDSPKDAPVEPLPDLTAPPKAQRHRLPVERAALTHKFSLGGHEGYLTIGMYPNGQPGELFVRMSKEGSTISGLMDQFAMMVSVALQHGVPLAVLTDKMVHTRFDPSGWTGDEKMGFAKSPMDYIGRFLQARFLEGEQLPLFLSSVASGPVPAPQSEFSSQFGDAPTCDVCGQLMQRSGTCFKCACGSSSGCS